MKIILMRSSNNLTAWWCAGYLTARRFLVQFLADAFTGRSAVYGWVRSGYSGLLPLMDWRHVRSPNDSWHRLHPLLIELSE